MKKGSSEKKPEKPKSNAVLASKLLKGVQESLAKQLSTGKMAISPVTKALPVNPDALRRSLPQQDLESIESSLNALRSSIHEQRASEQAAERARRAQAVELIERMRREKEEHQERLRQHSQREVLHRRLYSETTLNQMRQKIEERIANKRQQIEERVRAIEQRRANRDGQAASQEVQYWEHRQKAKSSARLPALPATHQAPTLPPLSLRKGSLAVLPAQYDQQASRLLQLARMRQENAELREFEESYSSRLESIKGRSLQEPPLRSSELYSDNKHKLMGNEFLKESLLLIKKPTLADAPAEPTPTDEPPLAAQAHEAQINKNAQVEALREKWARMLSKVRHGEIGSEQCLELLNGLEKRLDRVDLSGVADRLKLKYEVFSGQVPLSAFTRSVQELDALAGK